MSAELLPKGSVGAEELGWLLLSLSLQALQLLLECEPALPAEAQASTQAAGWGARALLALESSLWSSLLA